MNRTAAVALLNEVQSFLINQSNEKGINLADHFATPDEFKKFVVAFAFKGLREAGADIKQAFEAVMGEGEYEALFARVTAR